jgi:hypothetical protein
MCWLFVLGWWSRAPGIGSQAGNGDPHVFVHLENLKWTGECHIFASQVMRCVRHERRCWWRNQIYSSRVYDRTKPRNREKWINARQKSTPAISCLSETGREYTASHAPPVCLECFSPPHEIHVVRPHHREPSHSAPLCPSHRVSGHMYACHR